MSYSRKKIEKLREGFRKEFIQVLVEEFVEDHDRFKKLVENTNLTITDVFSAFKNKPEDTDFYQNYNELCNTFRECCDYSIDNLTDEQVSLLEPTEDDIKYIANEITLSSKLKEVINDKKKIGDLIEKGVKAERLRRKRILGNMTEKESLTELVIRKLPLEYRPSVYAVSRNLKYGE